METTIKVVEKAFRDYGNKQVQMPPKGYLNFEIYHGDLRAMPAYLPDLDIAGVKIVNCHPENRKYDLPTAMALIILNDPKTGAPISIMDGTYLTNMRTGAAGAIATKYLGRKDSKILGLVGAGAQAITQLLALRKVMQLEKVKVVDKDLSYARRFAEKEASKFGVDIEVTDVKNVVKADVISTITPSHQPIVKFEWITPGTHINAIGADAKGKQELDPRILKNSKTKIVIDDWEQASRSGEINVPFSQGLINKNDIYGTLGEIVAGLKAGRENYEEITVFDSTGLGIQDISTAYEVYKIAMERGIGQKIKFF